MEYQAVAEFAQTWGLLYMVVLFAGAVFYAFRPGSKKKFEDAARNALKED